MLCIILALGRQRRVIGFKKRQSLVSTEKSQHINQEATTLSRSPGLKVYSKHWNCKESTLWTSACIVGDDTSQILVCHKNPKIGWRIIVASTTLCTSAKYIPLSKRLFCHKTSWIKAASWLACPIPSSIVSSGNSQKANSYNKKIILKYPWKWHTCIQAMTSNKLIVWSWKKSASSKHNHASRIER